MKAASKHLCSVTLELGGKCPCFVDDDINLDVTARRIAWSKGFNLGQTCLSPDYVLVKKEMQDKLIEALIHAFKQFYGEDPKKSPDLGRMINKRHTQRVASLLSDIPQGSIVYGGEVDEEENYIAPTIIKAVPLSTSLKIMRDEIFGPLLPIIPVDNFDEAIDFVNSNPRPLGLYVFSHNTTTKDYVLSRTHSGGAVCNDVMVHIIDRNLPFGGVGASGMGSYHGKKSFLAFSHERSVLYKSFLLDLSLRYPPYLAKREGILKKLFSM